MKIKIEISEIVIKFLFRNDSLVINEIFNRYKNFISNKKTRFVINVFFDDIKLKDKEVVLLKKGFKRDDFYFNGRDLRIKPNIYSFDSFLRVLISLNLNRENGFLIHSSGISKDGYAFIFAGKSGSGKTTIANFSKNKFDILSDELIPIRIDKKIYAYSSPFWGSMKKPENINLRCVLKNIFFIKKSNKLKEIHSKNYFLKLISCIMNFSKNTKDNKILIDKIMFLHKKNIIKTLYFPKNKKKFICWFLDKTNKID